MADHHVYTIREASEQTGIPYCSIRGWVDKKYLVPTILAPRRGQARLFSEKDLDRIRFFAVLKMWDDCARELRNNSISCATTALARGDLMPNASKKPMVRSLRYTMDVPLLTLDDCARLANNSLAWWRKAVARGQIPIVRIGRSIRVRRQDLDEFLENCVVNDQ